MDNCIFCRIANKELPAQIVYEDGGTVAFLDIHPVNPGHVLVVPKEHAATILDISPHSLTGVMDTVQRIAPAVLAGVGASGFNIGVNTGSVAGQAVMHFHLHLMPRFEGDGYELWHGPETSTDEIEAVAQKIREQIG
jgi:histidine triad (HIT) family protein